MSFKQSFLRNRRCIIGDPLATPPKLTYLQSLSDSKSTRWIGLCRGDKIHPEHLIVIKKNRKELVLHKSNTSFTRKEGDDLATFMLFNAIHQTQMNLVDDDHVVLEENSPSSALTLMRDLADGSDVDYGGAFDPAFVDIYLSSQPDGNGIPTEDLGGVLNWLRLNHPQELSRVLYYDEDVEKFTVALILVKTDSQGMEMAEA